MRSQRNNSHKRQKHSLLAGVLLCLFLSGCGGKYWTETLEEEDSARIAEIVSFMQQETGNCPDSLDANAFVFWKNPLAEHAFAGYLQLLSPSFAKFIISNPLGQPILAFSSDGRTFHTLDTLQRIHIHGNLSSFALRNDIPPILLSSDWYAYFTGRLPERPIQMKEVKHNASDQTVWLPLASSVAEEKVYLHLHPENRQVLGYLFLDKEGRTLAQITYKEKQNGTDLCTLREEINITDLPWGTELRIELKEISSEGHFQETDFSLPVPEGYGTQLRP